MHVAQRLQSEAEGGETVARAATMVVADAIASERIGPRYIKGREEPVEAFRVVVSPREEER